MYNMIFVDEWPWWAGGLGIGLFVLFYGFVFNKVIGMSTTIENAIREWRDPVLPKRSVTVDFGEAAIKFAKEKGLDLSDMGLPSLKVSAGLPAQRIELTPRWIVLGMLLGGLLSGFTVGNPWTFSLGSGFDALFPIGIVAQAAILTVGGFLVGFGARMAGGCPSGHGLGGLSTLSRASLVAVSGYFVSGIALTRFLRWLH